MRAGGRGGRQGPRGDPVPRGPFLRPGASMRTGLLPRSGLYCYFIICRRILLGWPSDVRRFRHCFVKWLVLFLGVYSFYWVQAL